MTTQPLVRTVPGSRACQPKPHLYKAGLYIYMLAYMAEDVIFIELSFHLVVLEHVKLKEISSAPCEVHQRPPDSPAMVFRVNEKPPDFVPNQRKETDQTSILLEDPRLGVWQIDLSNLILFLLEIRLVEEWMANQ